MKLTFRPRDQSNSLLKSDEDYQTLFSESYHLNTFKNVICAKKQIMLRIQLMHPDVSSNYRNNIVFHVLSYISAKEFRNAQHAAVGWARKTLADIEIDQAIEVVTKIFKKQGETDQIAKNRNFGEIINDAARKN